MVGATLPLWIPASARMTNSVAGDNYFRTNDETGKFNWCRLLSYEKEKKLPGDDLFSQALESQVSWALKPFTAVFGKGTGGTTSHKTPGSYVVRIIEQRAKNKILPKQGREKQSK